MSKKILYILAVFIILILSGGLYFYSLLFNKSIHPPEGKSVIQIPANATYNQVMDTLKIQFNIENEKVLKWVAKKKNYPVLVKPGRYIVDESISPVELINILRSGRQSEVKVTFNNIRYLSQLAGKIGKQIEADSAAIMDFFNDPGNYAADGFTQQNIISVFIPDTYSMFWNTTPQELYKRMLREYNRFWDKERLSKAESLGLDKYQVAILASIVDDEVLKSEEKPIIAGVYINRIKRGIPLQACPTIKFALNDFTITRVLNKHLVIDSPYNTYLHNGFPPGPIGCPTKSGLDAVLNAEKHEYIFFAAKADFSGYHNFSRTLAEHNRYANEYQRELNKRRIFR